LVFYKIWPPFHCPEDTGSLVGPHFDGASRSIAEHLYFWIQGLRDFALAESHLSCGTPMLRQIRCCSRFSHRKISVGLEALSARIVFTEGSHQPDPRSSVSRRIRPIASRIHVGVLSTCPGLSNASDSPVVGHRSRRSGCHPRRTAALRSNHSPAEEVGVGAPAGGRSLSKLGQSSFDADQESLTNLQLQKQTALIMAQTVESTCLRASQLGVMTVEDDLPMINKTVQANHVAERSMRLKQIKSLSGVWPLDALNKLSIS
jgi:integrator complex subunit 7